MNNFLKAKEVVDELLSWGVVEFYVCAGARNMPLAEVLWNSNIQHQVFRHFEERSCGFYALGRAKALRAPVAVVVTSGTAVAELLPAVMEAHYSALPLVIVSADRPEEERETGAPQCVLQLGIFGPYVQFSFEFEGKGNISYKPYKGPAHLNVAFDHHLQSTSTALYHFSPSSIPDLPEIECDPQELFHLCTLYKRPLVYVGPLHPSQQKYVAQVLAKLNLPTYAEPLSGLRELLPSLLACPLFQLKALKASGCLPDVVIKLGGTPTHRLWRDLSETLLAIDVWSFHESLYGGSARAQHRMVLWQQLAEVGIPVTYSARDWAEGLRLQEEKRTLRLLEILHTYPQSEQGFIHQISTALPHGTFVYLGNSLPIRYWEECATYQDRSYHIGGNRGANGIDGQVSSFYGESGAEGGVAILGDLTTLYDLAAPWILNQHPHKPTALVIFNNEGGRIFEQVPGGQMGALACNTHTLQFAGWAQMWGLAYTQAPFVDPLWFSRDVHQVIELRPDLPQTRACNKALSCLFSETF